MPLPSEQLLATRPIRPRAAEPPEEPEPRSLHEFVDDVRAAARFAADFGAELARSPLARDLDGRQISEVGQTLFELDAIRRGEIKDHIALRRLQQADRALELRRQTVDLSRERFHFRAAEAVLAHFAEIKAVHDDHALPSDAKLAAMRRILFAALPASPDELAPADHAADETDLA